MLLFDFCFSLCQSNHYLGALFLFAIVSWFSILHFVLEVTFAYLPVLLSLHFFVLSPLSLYYFSSFYFCFIVPTLSLASILFFPLFFVCTCLSFHFLLLFTFYSGSRISLMFPFLDLVLVSSSLFSQALSSFCVPLQPLLLLMFFVLLFIDFII